MNFRDNILVSFDKQDLDNEYQRRLAFFSLYDFFQNLLLEIGVKQCGISSSVLKPCPVKTRWDYVKGALSEALELPDWWDRPISNLHKLRNRLVHDETDIPTKQELESIRKQASEFTEWMKDAGVKYLRESSKFSFTRRFMALSRWYIIHTRMTFERYGEEVPYSVKGDLPHGDQDSYKKIQVLSDTIETRLNEIDSVNDLKKSDLNNLISLAREIERIDAREGVYIEFKKCPKCGEKITQTQQNIGGSHGDSVLSAIEYRIGCEKCDFEVFSEVIDV